MGFHLREFSEKVGRPFSENSLRQNHHFCHESQNGIRSKSGRMTQNRATPGDTDLVSPGQIWSDVDHPMYKIGWSKSGQIRIREDPIPGKFVPIWYKFSRKTQKQMGLRNLPSWEISGSLILGWEDRGVSPDGFPSKLPVPSPVCPQDK